MSDSADTRFAAPQAHVEDVFTGEQGALAGRWTRLLAAIVDGLIVGCAYWAVVFIPGFKSLLDETMAQASMTDLKLRTPIVGLVLFLFIQGWPLLTRGQTIAKMIFGLRIVRSDGSKPDAWRLLGLRYGIGFLCNVNAVAYSIYALLDCLLIFRASRKCLHDSIADTKVIKL